MPTQWFKKLLKPFSTRLLIAILAWYALPALAQNDVPLDWVALPNTTSLCNGSYSPLFSPQLPLQKNQSTYLIDADHLSLQPNGQSTLQGNVVITQPNWRAFYADSVTLWRQANKIQWIEAPTGIDLFERHWHLHGSFGHWQADTLTLWIENAKYYFYPKHAHGSAQSIEHISHHQTKLRKATYSTCAPGSNTWHLVSKNMILLHQQGKGKAKNIQLKIKDQPVFYWPYLEFPLDNRRKSGFLFPHYSASRRSGFSLSLPFYWNIAPNYDATFTPQLLTKRGVNWQSQFRYLTPTQQGDLQLNWLPKDKAYQAFKQQQPLDALLLGPNDPRVLGLGHHRYRLGGAWVHQAQLSKNWQANINWAYVNDDNYFVDLGNDLHSNSTNKLLQNAKLNYHGSHWQHTLNMEQYQTLYPWQGPITQEDYRRHPQWVFNALYPNIYSHFSWALQGEVVNFTHKRTAMGSQPALEGQRYHLRPALSYRLSRSFGTLVPRLQYDFLYYQRSSTQGQSSQLSRSIPIVDIDGQLNFERMTQRGVQTLIPRLYYLYVPYRNQSHYPNFDSSQIEFSLAQMFRDNRFSGRDRLGDSHQLTASITSQYLTGPNFQEYLSAELGQVFYFTQRRVQLPVTNYLGETITPPLMNTKSSNIFAGLNITPQLQTSINTNVEWNPHQNHIAKWSLYSTHKPQERAVVNLSYDWIKNGLAVLPNHQSTQHLSQLSTSMVWPLTRKWHVLGQIRYDLQFQRMISSLAGVEYNSCCFALQLVGSRYLRPNQAIEAKDYAQGIYLQLMFKGLSTVGTLNIENKLQQAIPNYTPFRQYNTFD